MSHFLIRQAAKVIAGSAAPQMASQIAQRLTTPSVRPEDRRRFLIWLSGPFKSANPQAYDQLWARMRGNDPAIDALTGVFLELQSAGPSAMGQWFAQLSESDDAHFKELIAAMTPEPSEAQQIVQQASIECRVDAQRRRTIPRPHLPSHRRRSQEATRSKELTDANDRPHHRRTG